MRKKEKIKIKPVDPEILKRLPKWQQELYKIIEDSRKEK
jgi:hypothetical protein